MLNPDRDRVPDSSGGDPRERDELLAQADFLKLRLEREAQAARADAKRAELEQLVAASREGDLQPLRDWLSKYADSTNDSPSAVPSASSAPLRPAQAGLGQHAKDPQAQVEMPPESTSTAAQDLIDSGVATGAGQVSPWAALALASESRVRDHAKRLRKGKSAPEVIAELKDEGSKGAAGRSEVKPRLQSPSPKSGGDSRPDEQASASGKAQEVARLFDASATENDRKKASATLVKSKLGGVAASLIAHLMLIPVLAFVTLKLPASSASLGLVSSSVSVSEETFEISESIDVASPEAAAEPVPDRPAPPDLSDSMSELSSAISSDFASDMTQASVTSASVASAAAKMTSGGKPSMSQASFYGAASSGNCFSFVIDGSGSMRGGPWEAAKGELLRSLASFSAQQRFHIIFFNRELHILPRPGEREPATAALYATPENLEHARSWLNTLRIDIGAPPVEALDFAIELEPDAIYLLTDGDTKVDVVKHLKKANRVEDFVFGEQVKVPIHTIAFYSLKGRELLTQVAAENKGQFIYVPDPRK